VLRLDRPVGPVLESLAANNILGGFDLSNHYPELGNTLLVCATETKTDADLEAYAAALDNALQDSQAKSA
jgi:glycine dehydrogenase subunit 1